MLRMTRLGTFTTYIIMKTHLHFQNVMLYFIYMFLFVFARRKDEIEQKLRNFNIKRLKVPYVRILIVGAVGAGKSSFINSVNNAFQGRITCEALVATGSERSFTKTVKI